MSATLSLRSNQRLWGTFLVISSGIFYGLVGYFGIQLFYQGFTVAAMLFWRFFVATLWMLASVLILRRGRRRHFEKAQVMLMIELTLVGAISYAGGSAFYYLSSLRIGTGPAMVIFFSFPVFVTLFSILFKQTTMNRYVALALVMVVSGLVLLNGSGKHNLDNIGIFLALVASFSYAIYVYYSQFSSTKADILWLTLFICAGCAIVFLAVVMINHTFQMPPTPRAWRDILILGILATAIPIQLLLNGLKYISSVKASILSVLEAITTVVVGVMFLNESLSLMQVVGILIVLSGAIVIQFEKQSEFKARAPLK